MEGTRAIQTTCAAPLDGYICLTTMKLDSSMVRWFVAGEPLFYFFSFSSLKNYILVFFVFGICTLLLLLLISFSCP
jgi:hypothetical protein